MKKIVILILGLCCVSLYGTKIIFTPVYKYLKIPFIVPFQSQLSSCEDIKYIAINEFTAYCNEQIIRRDHRTKNFLLHPINNALGGLRIKSIYKEEFFSFVGPYDMAVAGYRHGYEETFKLTALRVGDMLKCSNQSFPYMSPVVVSINEIVLQDNECVSLELCDVGNRIELPFSVSNGRCECCFYLRPNYFLIK